MSDLNTELTAALLKNESLDEFFRSHLEAAMNDLLPVILADRSSPFPAGAGQPYIPHQIPQFPGQSELSDELPACPGQPGIHIKGKMIRH